MTIQQAAQTALDVQDACNLSGVTFAFADAMRAVCDEAHRVGEGTEWRNHHPVAVLFANKLAELTGQYSDDTAPYSRAYDACRTLADGGAA